MTEEEALVSPEHRQFIELLADIVVESLRLEAGAADLEQPEGEQEPADSEAPTVVYDRRTRGKGNAGSDTPARPSAATIIGQWDVRDLGDGVTLELLGGGRPALVLRQDDHAIRVELAHVKGFVAALVAGAADLGEVLSVGSGRTACVIG